jgi:DNA-binding Lrp family transcriptional regulator
MTTLGPIMTEIHREIIACLQYYGPCTLEKIAEALLQRNLPIISCSFLLAACQELVKQGKIKKATGWDVPAFKL